MDNKVSIIVPTYNSEVYLSDCLTSLLNQSYSNIEIIVIDDGSEDSTQSIIAAFNKLDSRILYFFQPNGGVSRARNRGIDLASGKYITFVDSDDVVSKFYIEQLIYAFEHYKVELASINHTDNIDKLSNTLSTSIEIVNAKKARQKMLTHSQAIFEGYIWEKMFLTELVKKHVRFNEKVALKEDLLFIIDYLEHATCGCRISNTLYFYRGNEFSTVNNLTSYQYETWITMAEIVMEKEPVGTELYLGATEEYYTAGRIYLECLSKENLLSSTLKRHWLKKQIGYFFKRRTIKQLKRVVSAFIQKVNKHLI